jgi:hypothetical protein
MVRCFDAAYDGTRSHLILDDLSESHGRLQLGPQNRPAETETARLQAVARAYARVHAATWGRWQLGWRPGRCFLTEHEIVGEPAPAALLELVPACHGNPRLELRPERLSALMTAVELCRSDRSRILCVRQGLETVW